MSAQLTSEVGAVSFILVFKVGSKMCRGLFRRAGSVASLRSSRTLGIAPELRRAQTQSTWLGAARKSHLTFSRLVR